MDFLAYMGSEREDIDIVPDLPEGTTAEEVPRVSHEEDVVVLKDTPETISRRKDIEEDYTRRIQQNQKGNQEETTTIMVSEKTFKRRRKSDKKGAKSHKMSRVQADFALAEGEDTHQAEEAEFVEEPPRYGVGKSPMAVRRMKMEIPQGHDESSESQGAEPSGSGSPPSQHIPEVPKSKAPFKVTFPRIPANSRLDKYLEREDFVTRIIPPARLHDVALLSIEKFQSSTNETSIRHMSEQTEFWRQWDLMEAENEELKSKNKELCWKVRNFDIRDPEIQTQKVADMEAENVILKNQAEMAEQEVVAYKNKIEELMCEKTKVDDELSEEKVKSAQLALEVNECKVVEKELCDKLQEMDDDIDRLTADRAELIRGIPSIFDKLRSSTDFAKEMGVVLGYSLNVGFNKALLKVKEQIPDFNVTKVPGYRRGAVTALREVGQEFAQKRFEYLNVLASNADLTDAEIFMTPSSLFDESAPVQPTTSSTAPSGSVVQNP